MSLCLRRSTSGEGQVEDCDWQVASPGEGGSFGGLRQGEEPDSQGLSREPLPRDGPLLSIPRSFGVVLWELLTGEIPYKDVDSSAIIWGVGSNSLHLPVPSSCPDGFKILLRQCW